MPVPYQAAIAKIQNSSTPPMSDYITILGRPRLFDHHHQQSNQQKPTTSHFLIFFPLSFLFPWFCNYRTIITMKSFSNLAVLALVAAATASPTSRRTLAARQNTCIVPTVDSPSSADVEASIKQWVKDVQAVNNFLDTIGQITGK